MVRYDWVGSAHSERPRTDSWNHRLSYNCLVPRLVLAHIQKATFFFDPSNTRLSVFHKPMLLWVLAPLAAAP